MEIFDNCFEFSMKAIYASNYTKEKSFLCKQSIGEILAKMLCF